MRESNKNHQSSTPSTEAIHIVISKAVETEEFLKNIRRFPNQRGCPKQIFSENGTVCNGSLNELVK